jgi:hypothetical protein
MLCQLMAYEGKPDSLGLRASHPPYSHRIEYAGESQQKCATLEAMHLSLVWTFRRSPVRQHSVLRQLLPPYRDRLMLP